MGKSHVKVYVRTRPTGRPADNLKITEDNGTVAVTLDKVEGAGYTTNPQDTLLTFKFDSVLNNVSQETMYNTCVADVVDNLMAGYNCTIFAYGQTGAGKTYTMTGDIRNYHQRGVVPRAIHQIFREADLRIDRLYKMHVSYLEIYNEIMYDLLSDTPGTSEGLTILEDGNNTVVRGLTKVPVHSEEEALAQFFVGEQGRSTANHVLNTNSSRSHCIFTVHVEMRTSAEANEKAVLAKLHLVDLAGSERTKKTNVTGQTLKEANFINKSLTFLEQTVNALSRKEAHVPFRQSKLTSVLRDALGGNCKTAMIANIWPEPSHMEETVSTLRFAGRVKTLVTDTYVTESNDPGLLLKRYERQIKELKQELAMRDALAGRARVNYDDLKESEQRALHTLARKFLSAEADVDDLPLDSLKNIREMFRQVRTVHQASASDLERERAAKAQAVKEAVQAAASQAEKADGVGEVERGAGGMSIGTAPTHARPTGEVHYGPGSPDSQHRQSLRGGRTTSPNITAGEATMHDLTATLTLADNNAAFTKFKHEVLEGRELNGVLKQRQQQLRDVTQNIKVGGSAVNEAKAQIDELTGILSVKKIDLNKSLSSLPPGGDAVTDAEHYQLLQKLKAAKKTYRDNFDALKEFRAQREMLVALVGDARQQLVGAFNAWFAAAEGDALADVGSEQLDAGEAFERMQMEKISATDPDMTAYAAAKKKTAVMPGGVVRSPALFGGEKARAYIASRKQASVGAAS